MSRARRYVSLFVLLLLLLTACQTLPSSGTVPAGSTPSSSSITPPPSSSAVPPMSVPATTPAETADTGYAFVYKGDNPFIGIDPDCSGCTVGHLYWVDIATSVVTVILEEPVLNDVQEGAYVYYVKTAEPTRIYRTLIGDFTQHELIHETIYGKIDHMTIYPGIENYLQFIADNKKFVVMEFDTGEEMVLMEQCYIDFAYIPGRNGVLDCGIWFKGKHKETDSPYEQFIYNRDTGETVHDPSL